LSGYGSDDYERRVEEAELAIEGMLEPEAARQRQDEDRDRLRAKAARQAWLVGMMQHPEGRKWLKEVLDHFHTFELRFATTQGGQRDDLGTFTLAGEQRSGWWLWQQLDEADPVIASRLRRGS